MGNFQFDALRDSLNDHGMRLRALERFAGSGTILPFSPSLYVIAAGQPTNYTPYGEYWRHNDMLAAWATFAITGALGGGGDPIFFNPPFVLTSAWGPSAAGEDGQILGWWHVFASYGSTVDQGFVMLGSSGDLALKYSTGYPSGTLTEFREDSPRVWVNGDKLHVYVAGHIEPPQ